MKGLDNQAYFSASFTSKQSLSKERLYSQKLNWSDLIEKSIFICVSNFVASNYQKFITDI